MKKINDISKYIVEETEDFIVVDKPAGLACESSKSFEEDLVSLIKKYRALKKEEIYVGLIHRIDQPVRGLVLVAKNENSAAFLSELMRNGRIKKIYRACVTGKMPESQDRLEDYLFFDRKKNQTITVDAERLPEYKKGEVKKADLFYRVISYDAAENISELEIELGSGRHHQIRAQLAGLGHPIVGDVKYGGPEWEETGIDLVSHKMEFVGRKGVKYSFICKKPTKKQENS